MTIKKDQTIFDFITQHGGAVDGVFEMCLANGIGITDEVAPGTELTVEVTDKETVQFFVAKPFNCQTGYVASVGAAGIGGYQIGIDFQIN